MHLKDTICFSQPKPDSGHASKCISLSRVLKAFYNKTTTSPSLTALPRVSYDTGYGDLCLGRWKDKCIDALYASSLPKSQYWTTGSHGVYRAELNGFHRIGSFRFMALPREVRDKIYSYLLQPLIYTDGIKGQRCFAVTIQAAPIAKRNSCILMRKVIGIFHQLVGRHDLAHYPNRVGCYFLQASPLREVWVDGRGALALCDTLYLNWIRRAAYTSSNFRLELQQLLWERVSLKCINMDDLWVVPKMLTDRPAVLGGIKHLGISINAAAMPSGFDKKFFDWCVWMSRNVELEALRILLRLRETQLNVMAEGGGPVIDLLPCRMLTVTRVFVLIFSITTTPDSILQSSEVSPEEREQRWVIYSDKLRSFLIPDTLRRRVGPLTEMEQYSRNRI